MYLNILDDKRINLLHELDSLIFIKNFRIGGGTALSLMLGLRKSYDFDFFSANHFDQDILLKELKEKFGNRLELVKKESKISTLDLYIDDVQVSFFEYSYKEVDNKVSLNGFNNISLFSIKDIACMKSVALIQRGTKKDFFDLYFILKDKSISDKELISLLKHKYDDQNLITNLGYSLDYFEDAEFDVLPESFVEYSWEEIKKFYKNFQINYFKLI